MVRCKKIGHFRKLANCRKFYLHALEVNTPPLHVVHKNLIDITLSSNARRVPFENPQIYLNKKGKVCKARVNEWIINQI